MRVQLRFCIKHLHNKISDAAVVVAAVVVAAVVVAAVVVAVVVGVVHPFHSKFVTFGNS